MKRRKVVTIATIISIIVVIISSIYKLFMIYMEHKLIKDISRSSSIGIIGGADGPTSIFIAGKLQSHFISNAVTILFAIFALIGALYLIIIRNQDK